MGTKKIRTEMIIIYPISKHRSLSPLPRAFASIDLKRMILKKTSRSIAQNAGSPSAILPEGLDASLAKGSAAGYSH